MHGSNNLLRRLDKDGVANQSAISFVIGTGSKCWSKMVYKGLARSQRIYLATLSIRNVQLLLMRKMLRKLGCRPVTAGNIILKPKFLKKQQINLQYDVRKQNELKTGRDFPNNKFLNGN